MRKFFRIFWISVALGALFFWVYLPSISHYRDLKSQEEQLAREIGELDGKVEGLRDERDRIKNDTGYLEKIIRDELGLVKPGEIVYKFVPVAMPSVMVPVVSAAPAPAPVSSMPVPSISPSARPPVPAKISVPAAPVDDAVLSVITPVARKPSTGPKAAGRSQ